MENIIFFGLFFVLGMSHFMKTLCFQYMFNEIKDISFKYQKKKKKK